MIPFETKPEAHLYYIIQEAVHNAVKHGEPDNITITLAEKKDSFFITVDDDGIGMDMGMEDKSGSGDKGMGLNIMAHRTRQAACNIVWEKNNTKGTRVTITLPKGVFL